MHITLNAYSLAAAVLAPTGAALVATSVAIGQTGLAWIGITLLMLGCASFVRAAIEGMVDRCVETCLAREKDAYELGKIMAMIPAQRGPQPTHLHPSQR